MHDLFIIFSNLTSKFFLFPSRNTEVFEVSSWFPPHFEVGNFSIGQFDPCEWKELVLSMILIGLGLISSFFHQEYYYVS